MSEPVTPQTITVAGLRTRYAVYGTDGPALLMFSPGGFDSKLENWSSFSIYARLGLLPRLSERFRCVVFDRRESGESGGRVQRLAWSHYVEQAAGLLDHLGIATTHLMGGCVGCSSALAFAVALPERVEKLVLYSPAGGPMYRLRQQARFATHYAFAAEHGLPAVVGRARSHTKGFSQDPACGPWVTVLRTDEQFAARYVEQDLDRYLTVVAGTARAMFDRDTVPGPEAEDLLALDAPALIVPGQDESHAPSAARYLQESLLHADYWDMPVAEQTEATAPRRVLDFLG